MLVSWHQWLSESFKNNWNLNEIWELQTMATLISSINYHIIPIVNAVVVSAARRSSCEIFTPHTHTHACVSLIRIACVCVCAWTIISSNSSHSSYYFIATTKKVRIINNNYNIIKGRLCSVRVQLQLIYCKYFGERACVCSQLLWRRGESFCTSMLFCNSFGCILIAVLLCHLTVVSQLHTHADNIHLLSANSLMNKVVRNRQTTLNALNTMTIAWQEA